MKRKRKKLLSLLLFLLILLDLFSQLSFFGTRLIGFPLERTRINFSPFRSVSTLLQIIVNQVLAFQNQVLALPILDHAHVLEGAYDVVRIDSHLFAEGLDGDLLFGIITNVL